MENLVWWIIIVLLGMGSVVNFYEAGKGDYTKTNSSLTSLISGLVGLILALWGLLTLV